MSSTSIRYLRQRQRQRKLEDRAWQESLEQEQNEFMHMCRFRLEQANDYCHRLGKPQTFRLQPATSHHGARVVVNMDAPDVARGTGDGADTAAGRRPPPRHMSLQLFLREHEKLRDELDRGEGVAEASAAEAATSALFGSSGMAPPRGGGEALAGRQPQQQPQPPPQQQPQLSRGETVAQVGALLDSTRTMTARLDAQLEEMRRHGWNGAARPE